MVRPVNPTLSKHMVVAAPEPLAAVDPAPVPRDAGHSPAEAATPLGWRNQHLLHPQMLGRSVVMY